MRFWSNVSKLTWLATLTGDLSRLLAIDIDFRLALDLVVSTNFWGD